MPLSIWVFTFGVVVAMAAVGLPVWLRQGARERVVGALGRMVLGRVVAAQGACPLGLGVGAEVRFAPDGTTSPALCAPARAALLPFVAATLGGRPPVDTPCCPIWEHLLAFRFSTEMVHQAA